MRRLSLRKLARPLVADIPDANPSSRSHSSRAVIVTKSTRLAVMGFIYAVLIGFKLFEVRIDSSG